MMLDALEILKNEERLRVKIASDFRQELLKSLNQRDIANLSKILAVHIRTLERKLNNIKGNSFLLSELLKIVSYLGINKNHVCGNITKIKLGKNSTWISPLRMKLDEGYTEGVGYYVGDGRARTNRSVSTVNNNELTLMFFVNWLTTYFRIKPQHIRATVYWPNNDFNENEVNLHFSRILRLPLQNIRVVERKGKRILSPLVEIGHNNTTLKKLYDKSIIIVKNLCINNEDYAIAYLRGILVAEGSPKHHKPSSSRGVHIKMKSKELSEFNKTLLIKIGCKPAIYPTSDGEWVVCLSGVDDLERIKDIDGFKYHSKKREKLIQMLNTYKHKQVKKGDVEEIYLKRIFELIQIRKRGISVDDLANFFKRERSGVANVLHSLTKRGMVKRRHITKTGSPYSYNLTKKGKVLLSSFRR
ncbi:MAG: hypothetical protein NTX24_01245 [Candidatus Pacearchaeota archaeon]|nr:hypothetical protein [Candidatus Pacearchaeota archaeon]